MSAWLEGLVPPGYATAVAVIAGSLLLLILVLAAVRLLRGLSSGTFVAGGRNRRTRLAVMDAAAVDSRRRLVLVRRDDIEHLILIGGPTDLVIEQDIRMVTPGRRHTDREPEIPAAREPAAAPQAARGPEPVRPRLVSPQTPPPAPAAAPAKPAAFAGLNGDYPPRPAAIPTPAPVARPVPAAMAPQPTPVPPAPPERRAEPVFQVPKQDADPPISERGAVVMPLPVTREENAPPPVMREDPPAPAAAAPATHAETGALSADDDELLRELEVTLDAPDRRVEERPSAEPARDAGPEEISLEEEMSKLLGDLSGERR